MTQNSPMMRGRYWGPSSPGDGKLDPHSPDQSSLLLARINARARARKAAQSNITNGLSSEVQQNSVSNEKSQQEKVNQVGDISASIDEFNQVGDISASIDEFIKDMRNASSKGEEENSIANDDETKRKKKKKHKKKDANNDNTDVTVKTETIGDNIEPQVPKRKKKHNSECASEINNDINSLKAAEEEESSPCNTEVKRKKKKKQRENKIIKKEILDASEAPLLDREGGECEGREEGEGEMGKKKKKKKKRKELDISHHRENGDVTDGSLNNNLHIPTKIKMEVQEEFVEEANHVSIANDSHKFIGPQESEACDESTRKKKKKKRKHVKDEMEKTSNNTVDSNTPAPTTDSSNQPEEMANGEEVVEKEPPKKKKKKKDIKIEFPVGDDETKEMDVSKETQDASLPDTKIMLKKAKKIRKTNKKISACKMEIGGFTLLREVESSKTEKLHRILPHWLAHPTCLGRNLQKSGKGLGEVAGLAGWLREKLEENKITHFFPVQCAVIPEILASAGPLTARYRPRDICVSAPTGSGKTLAFVLPILQALHGRTVPKVRALILLPVQELANQVRKVFENYSRGSGLKIGIAVGQKSFVKEQAELVGQDYRGQHCLVDILVATPGRLADHLTLTPGLDLSALRYLVLDEADRMLAAEGGKWVARIEQTVRDHTSATSDPASLYAPSPPHRLLFSATLSHDPEQLQHVTLHHPRLFTVAGSIPRPSSGIVGESAGVVVGQYMRPAELSEEYVMVDETVKPLVLYHLISGRAGQEGNSWQKVLVFTNSRAATHRLSVLLACLAPDCSVAEFSSSTEKRQQIVSRFIAGKIDILVSSDAMARGLDIPEIEHVVSYDVTSVNTYVHRIGRTARAGRPGTALSLVTKNMMSEFKVALRSSGEGARELTVTTEELEPYEEQYVAALAKMKRLLQEEEQLKREVLKAGSKRNQVGRGGWAQGKAREKGGKKVKRLQHTWKPVRFR